MPAKGFVYPAKGAEVGAGAKVGRKSTGGNSSSVSGSRFSSCSIKSSSSPVKSMTMGVAIGKEGRKLREGDKLRTRRRKTENEEKDGK
jgi:hypothetical protein